ncbi:MAG: hypothetical protein AAF934_09560 [Bacteroidota bacterium]
MKLFMNISDNSKVNITRFPIYALLGLTLSVTAQELPKTTPKIPGTKHTILTDAPNTITPLRIDRDQKAADIKLLDISGEKAKEASFMMEPKFADRGKAIAKKLNKRDKKVEEAYKSDQYLGDFKSNAKFVKVFCRDHEYVDGDRVKVYVNDKVIQPDIMLEERFYGFAITLEKGFNKVDFEALNQGSSGPNTAEFKVYDDQGRLVSANQWNLTTGVKATLIIVKE